MPINQLQRDAFLHSPEFNAQVNGVVTQEAMYKANTWANMNQSLYQELSKVAKMPDQFGFVKLIISDSAWSVGYDAWATDPDGQSGAIGAAVNAWWEFSTGIKNEAPPAPEGTAQQNQQGQPLVK